MRELCERFLLHRESELSAGSLKIERSSLEHFASFCEERGFDFRELSREHLAAYLRVVPGGISHRARAMRGVRGFCRWAQRAGHLLVDPGPFPIPRCRPTLPRVPSVDQMLKLLEVPDTSEPLGLRDRLILELFYVLGLRREECHRLDVEHLDLNQRTVRVVGKGDHERLLPLSPKLLETCLAYLEESRPKLMGAEVDPALLVSKRKRKRRRLSGSFLGRVVKIAGQAIGLRLHPHLLRHACATHLIEAGVDYRQVQELLGHAQLKSTSRYTQISPQSLRREFFRCHPRARFSEQNEEDA
ncbi:MAG: tyrosine-type recombinase/integrase [Armatimonadetes bacterium]|nr:tyrosine-type recombinase/integrase [Armatimonadota bacterium]